MKKKTGFITSFFAYSLPSLSAATSKGIVLLSIALVAFNTGCKSSSDDDHDTKTGAPSKLSYTANPARYPVGLPITSNVLQSGGSQITEYSIDAPLPDGLTFDSGSGVIS